MNGLKRWNFKRFKKQANRDINRSGKDELSIEKSNISLYNLLKST